MSSPAAIIDLDAPLPAKGVPGGLGRSRRGDGIAHIGARGVGKPAHHDLAVDGGAQLGLTLAGTFPTTDDVGVRMTQATARSSQADLERGVQLLIVGTQGGVGDLRTRRLAAGGHGRAPLWPRSGRVPSRHGRTRLIPECTLGPGAENQDGRSDSGAAMPVPGGGQAVSVSGVALAWTVRKQSEQYTGLSMRGLKGTCAALPHSEQMTAKYSRADRYSPRS